MKTKLIKKPRGPRHLFTLTTYVMGPAMGFVRVIVAGWPGWPGSAAPPGQPRSDAVHVHQSPSKSWSRTHVGCVRVRTAPVPSFCRIQTPTDAGRSCSSCGYGYGDGVGVRARSKSEKMHTHWAERSGADHHYQQQDQHHSLCYCILLHCCVTAVLHRWHSGSCAEWFGHSRGTDCNKTSHWRMEAVEPGTATLHIRA